MKIHALLLASTALMTLPGCATVKGWIAPERTPATPAVLQAYTPPPVQPALPVRTKPTPAAKKPGLREAADPAKRVANANAAARVQPSGADYENAVQVYPWSAGALFQVYSAPGRVTDIALEPGEQLAGSGPVAAGDTTRWIIGDTESGSGATRQVHILVKPTRSEIDTNLVINTDRRTYHLELRATDRAYMASVSWRYPAPPVSADTFAAVDPLGALNGAALNFGYRLKGRAPWKPVRVFDNGRQVFIEFPPSVDQGELPPLFVAEAAGGEIVNYRVRGRHMIVDRLFSSAELRLGGKGKERRVRIEREERDG
jgi:P-type conjugative transfer protein TrbG